MSLRYTPCDLLFVVTVQPNCLKGRVVCGTVYGDIHLKYFLGSIARVGYCIPVPDFYQVLHDLRCRKSTIMDKSNEIIFCLLVSLDPPAQPRLSTGDAIVANWESMNLTVTPWQPPQTDHEQCTHLSVVYKIR